MNLRNKLSRKINNLIRRGQWYNETVFPDCKKFWTYNTFNTQVINLGSSSGLYAFNYEGLPVIGANFALRRNPLSGDLAVLKNYYSYLKPQNATVILPLCPFSSLSGSYECSADRYYTILYPSSIDHYSFWHDLEVKKIRDFPFSTYPISSFFRDVKACFRKRKEKEMAEFGMEEDANRWINNWLMEFSLEQLTSPLSLIHLDSIEDAVSHINEMVYFCKERDINFYIVIPPIYASLLQYLTSDIQNRFIDVLIKKISDKNCHFLNYIDDSRFSQNIFLYRNSFFLNDKGARLFTSIVLKDINLI